LQTVSFLIFLFWLGVFHFSFKKRGASALSPKMRLRLVVGVCMLLGWLLDPVVQHKQLHVKS